MFSKLVAAAAVAVVSANPSGRLSEVWNQEQTEAAGELQPAVTGEGLAGGRVRLRLAVATPSTHGARSLL